MEFKDILKRLRMEMSMSQEELGNKVGMKKSNISKYERGALEPGLDTVKLFASVFGVSIDYLLGCTNYPSEIHEIGALGVNKYVEKHGITKLAEIAVNYRTDIDTGRKTTNPKEQKDKIIDKNPDQVPEDIAQFAIDPKNQALIRKIQGMLVSGYSAEAIQEWLDSYVQQAKHIEKAILEKYSLKELQEKGAWLDHDPTPEEQELLDKLMKKHKEGKAFPFQTKK